MVKFGPLVLCVLLVGLAGCGGGPEGDATPTADTAKTPRLVVLPWHNLTGEGEREYQAEAWALELIDCLSRLEPQALEVMAAGTTLRYLGQAPEPATLAEQLGVDHVLEATVRDDDRGLRVVVTLNHVDGRELLNETFEIPADEGPDWTDEIASRVAGAWSLELPLGPGDTRGGEAVPVEALRAWRHGRVLVERAAPGTAEQAEVLLRQALELAPRMAGPHVALARLAIRAPGPWTERVARARAEAETAAAQTPDDPEVRLLLGDLASHGDWDWERAEREYRAAVAAAPGRADAREGLAGVLSATGRHEEALREAARAVSLDRGSVRRNAEAGWIAYRARDYGQAVTWCGQASEIELRDMAAMRCQMVSNLALGETGEAARFARGVMLALGTREEEIERVAGDVDEASFRYYFGWLRDRMSQAALAGAVDTWHLARAEALAENPSIALDLLERALDERSWFLPLTDVDPGFDPVRDDPRFRAVVERLGL